MLTHWRRTSVGGVWHKAMLAPAGTCTGVYIQHTVTQRSSMMHP